MEIPILPVVAGASGVLTAGVVMFRWLRPKFTVTVNCWFCNSDTVVPYGNKNCWDCPHCEQYNGFAKDGSYNKPIPAQYDESLNFPVSGSKSWMGTPPASNGFCEECNRNQHLKIVATAKFVAQNEDEFDTEVDNFKLYLDRAYRLCRNCEAVLRQTLGQQDSWLRPKLMGFKLQENGRNLFNATSASFNPFIAKPKLPWYLTVLRLVALIAVLTAFISGFVHLEKNCSRQLLHLVTVLPKGVLTYLDIIHQNCCYVVVSGLLCIGVVLLTGKSSLRSVDTSVFVLWMVLCFIHEHFAADLLGLSSDSMNVLRPASCIATSVITLCAIFWSRKPPKFQRTQKIGSASNGDISNSSYSKSQSYCNGFVNHDPRPFVQDNHISTSVQNRGRGLNTSLGAMSLGSPAKVPRKSGMFSVQKYSTPSQVYSQCRISPQSYMELQQRKPIISPPRLHYRSSSPSSWVSSDTWNIPSFQRGGLWSREFNSSSSCIYSPGHGRSSPPLGRCSPRPFSVCGDTGNLFGRPNSFYSPSCPPSRPGSRQGSVCGDDRASVFSEPPYLPQSTYQADYFSPISTCNGKLNQENAADRSSEGNNSSRSSSACPVDTTTASIDTYVKDARHGFSWHLILLFLSISVNVTAFSYFAFQYTMNNLLFPPFSLSTKS